ncbi:TRAP transporter small permease subunit [Tranquillimonas alkanivorans]|uniref:Tripartite ATP-independent transporter, DctQ component n=1 Tax=Tranquillimonas alkanivorans TaxID=441119 RepID=A0A1I5MJQ1_9RHOB|nr:TRAP transporter small permease subunit [Tranquillimonas alkanivorans]SFP09769.1 hypothetical protein SAMN04488047_102302 [Tranquillimonas alkanivorans]
MLDFILWFFANIAMSFWNVIYAVTHPGLWLDWSNGEALMRFIYHGASAEMFFVVLTTFLIVTGIGIWKNAFMWGCVRVLEGFANGVGRFFAWAGLIMVLQQIVIVFMQRVFAASQISLGFGSSLSLDVSWWSEELKLYNAMVVALCCTYTFVQRGHVRVDLVYSAVSFRTKRVIDMAGSLLFMMPAAILIWLYAWYFMWRHLITPKVSASDSLELLMRKASIIRWNVETVGFSPNGFNGYFLFKVLMVAFTAMVFLQAVAFFYRSYLEWKEGPESEGKYLDRDTLGAGEEAYEGTH